MIHVGPHILPVNKPPGPSSFSMIRKFKRICGKKYSKIGHFGSLDPFAEGLLLIGFNGAMKFNNTLQKKFSKTYVAKGHLGLYSPTGDASRPDNIVSVDCPLSVKKMTQKQLEDFCCSQFLGHYQQSPHHFSAAKYKGKPLYEYARKNIMIDKPSVKRFISDIHILKWDYPALTFQAIVSSGTYIRGLFEDICLKLGTKGILFRLKRTAIGPILLEKSVAQKEWDMETLSTSFLSTEQIFYEKN